MFYQFLQMKIKTRKNYPGKKCFNSFYEWKKKNTSKKIKIQKNIIVFREEKQLKYPGKTPTDFHRWKKNNL